MHTFSHVSDPANPHDIASVSISIPSGANLTQMCETFEAYLRACGFQFDGCVDIVREDE